MARYHAVILAKMNPPGTPSTAKYGLIQTDHRNDLSDSPEFLLVDVRNSPKSLGALYGAIVREDEHPNPSRNALSFVAPCATIPGKDKTPYSITPFLDNVELRGAFREGYLEGLTQRRA